MHRVRGQADCLDNVERLRPAGPDFAGERVAEDVFLQNPASWRGSLWPASEAAAEPEDCCATATASVQVAAVSRRSRGPRGLRLPEQRRAADSRNLPSRRRIEDPRKGPSAFAGQRRQGGGHVAGRIADSPPAAGSLDVELAPLRSRRYCAAMARRPRPAKNCSTNACTPAACRKFDQWVTAALGTVASRCQAAEFRRLNADQPTRYPLNLVSNSGVP